VNEEKGDRQKALRTLSRLIRRLFQRYRPKADIGAQNFNMLYVLLSGGTYSAERPSDRAWLEVERIAW
jgi:hypothetical protein